MSAEYNFTGGVRGKYCKAVQAGYIITILNVTIEDLTSIVLSINLLQKDQPSEEDIEAFSIVGKLIQYEFGGWFKKKYKKKMEVEDQIFIRYIVHVFNYWE